MNISRIFLWLACVYLIGFLSHAAYLSKTVYGDGIFYYSWLRSVVVDRDVHFANEYAHFGATQPKTHKGEYGNKYSIGPALLWAPAFITAHSLIHGDGYTLPYQVAVGSTTVLLTIFALVLLYRLLSGSSEVKIFAIVTIALATNIFFYGAIDTVNSHGVSFFVSVIYLSFLANQKPNWMLVGASLALLCLIRLQDFIFVLLLVPQIRSIKFSQLLFGFVLVFVPQLLAWNTLYGNFWTNPYLAGGEKFTLLSPHFLGVLFHMDSGLFLWTPVVALGAYGLWATKSRQVWCLVVFGLQLWLVASWSTWWQGASYSGRMFVSTLPLVAFGLTDGIETLKKRYGNLVTGLFIATLATLNTLSIIYFLLTH